MNFTENFTYEELIHSSTALRHNIDNVPKEQYIVNNLQNLAVLLQKIRDRFGVALHVNSGYRCKALNDVIGGASNSDHLYGAAADITCYDNRALWDTIIDMIKSGEIECRQAIYEYGGRWVHISINHSKNSKKQNQILYT